MFLGQASVSGQSVLQVRNWERFGSTGKGGRRSTGRMSAALFGTVCGLQALVRKRLLNLPGGAAAYGVWILLSALAAETCVPGTFLDDDHTPLTVEDLALLTDVRLEELQTALDILSGPQVRLIETVSLEEVLVKPGSDSAVGDVSDLMLHAENDADESHLRRLKVTATAKPGSDSTVGDVSDSMLHAENDADESHLRRLKVTATEAHSGSGVRVSGFAGSSDLPEQDRSPAKPEIRTHRPLMATDSAVGDVPDSTLQGENDADEVHLRRLKVTATAKPEDGGLDKIEQQMAQLAGVCQQIDQMERQVAAMTNSTPILTASRKGRPNGWKVNATLNPGKK